MKDMWFRNLTGYFRWIVAGVLLVAGILKILDPENMVEVLLFFELLTESNAYLFVYFASALEITLAILLIRKYKPKFTSVLVTSLCFLFLLIAVTGYNDGWEFVCGCLGRFSFGKFDLAMVIRNSTLFIMSVGIYFNTKKTHKRFINNN